MDKLDKELLLLAEVIKGLIPDNHDFILVVSGYSKKVEYVTTYSKDEAAKRLEAVIRRLNEPAS